MTKIERLKLEMQENLREFVEYQNAQLKAFEEFLKIEDAEELDEKIQEFDEEYKYNNSPLKDIVFKQNEITEKLQRIAWEVRTKQLEEGAIYES